MYNCAKTTDVAQLWSKKRCNKVQNTFLYINLSNHAHMNNFLKTLVLPYQSPFIQTPEKTHILYINEPEMHPTFVGLTNCSVDPHLVRGPTEQLFFYLFVRKDYGDLGWFWGDYYRLYIYIYVCGLLSFCCQLNSQSSGSTKERPLLGQKH